MACCRETFTFTFIYLFAVYFTTVLKRTVAAPHRRGPCSILGQSIVQSSTRICCYPQCAYHCTDAPYFLSPHSTQCRAAGREGNDEMHRVFTARYELNHIYIYTYIKVKVTLQQATKTQRWSRGIAVLFLYPGTR